MLVRRSAAALLSLLILGGLAAPTGEARTRKPRAKGPPAVAGRYDVTFKRVANTCGDTGLALLDGDKGTFTFEQRGRRLDVSFPMVPLMKGTVGDDGSFTAQAKRGRTAIQGLDGAYKLSGVFGTGKVDLVLVATYYRGTTSVPFCEQSYSATGARP